MTSESGTNPEIPNYELDEEIEFSELDGLFPSVIETSRLRLEKLSRNNVDMRRFYYYLSKSETIDEETQQMFWEPHKTLKQTYEYVERTEKEWSEGDHAAYLIRVRDSSSSSSSSSSSESQNTRDGEQETVAGNSGLRIDWEKRSANLGIWLRKKFWGRGYSGERAHALLELGFKHLELEVVKVDCSTENQKSKRAIEKYMNKYGGEYVGVLRNHSVDDDGEPRDVHHFSITRDDYLG